MTGKRVSNWLLNRVLYEKLKNNKKTAEARRLQKRMELPCGPIIRQQG
jgi:hypothetical protein